MHTMKDFVTRVVRDRETLAQSGLNVVVLGLALVLFAPRVVTTVGPGDSAEFVIASATLGIPHTSGYPLYTWLGKLFASLPIGGIPFRINLMSAVFASVAVMLLFHIAANEMRDRIGRHGVLTYAPAALCVVLLATADHFYRAAVVAEVYTLKCLFIALVLYLFIKYLKSSSAGHLYATSLVVGLGAGAHMSILLLVPFIVVLAARRVRNLKTALVSAAMLCVGLSQYFYLYLRALTNPVYHHPQARFFETMEWTGTDNALYNWIWFITGAKWHNQYVESIGALILKFGQLLNGVAQNSLLVGLALVALGILLYFRSADRTQRERGFLFLFVLVSEAIWFCSYRHSVKGMALPFFMTASLLIGLSFGLTAILIRPRLRSERSRRLLPYVLVAVLSLYGTAVLLTKRLPDLAKERNSAAFVTSMIEQLPARSTVDGLGWELDRVVLYFGIVEGVTIPFEMSECSDDVISEGRCFALGDAEQEYRRRGHRLIPYLRAEGMPTLYRIQAGDDERPGY